MDSLVYKRMKLVPLVLSLVGAGGGKRGSRPQAELRLGLVCGREGEERPQTEPGRSPRVVIYILSFYSLIIKHK